MLRLTPPPARFACSVLALKQDNYFVPGADDSILRLDKLAPQPKKRTKIQAAVFLVLLCTIRWPADLRPSGVRSLSAVSSASIAVDKILAQLPLQFSMTKI